MPITRHLLSQPLRFFKLLIGRSQLNFRHHQPFVVTIEFIYLIEPPRGGCTHEDRRFATPPTGFASGPLPLTRPRVAMGPCGYSPHRNNISSLINNTAVAEF